jgi:hypothetical protein
MKPHSGPAPAGQRSPSLALASALPVVLVVIAVALGFGLGFALHQQPDGWLKRVLLTYRVGWTSYPALMTATAVTALRRPDVPYWRALLIFGVALSSLSFGPFSPLVAAFAGALWFSALLACRASRRGLAVLCLVLAGAALTALQTYQFVQRVELAG